MDVRANWYPTRHIDPNEPGLQAAYCFQDGELAVHGRYLNRAALGGAALDLTTVSGTPLVGQGGGVYGRSISDFWYGTTVNVGQSTFAYSAEMEFLESVGAFSAVYQNGNGNHVLYNNAGALACSLNAGGVVSTAAFSLIGRGRFLGHLLFDGANELLLVNGTQYDSDAVAPSATNVGSQRVIGAANHTRVGVYNYRMTVAEARASYGRDFARKVLWQWTPRDVGEGPAGGILTGSASGVGGYTCPLGAATMGFVYRNGVGLCLTDSSAAAMSRIDFEHESRPAFGSWLSTHYIRAAATDNPRFGLTDIRGRDFTAAAAPGYWWQVQQAAGVMQLTVHEANGAAVLTVNHTAAGAADNRVDSLVTRAVNGDFRAYLAVNGVWVGNSATVWNDVTTLATGVVSLAPRGGHVSRLVRTQGEMTPQELGL